MDWYSWLSKSGLEPSLVYDYSLLLAENELEEDDIPHFDHEFLKSMGISVAKHRLEILKLARSRKAKSRTSLLTAVVKTKKSLSRYFNALFSVRCNSSSAIVVVPKKPAAAAVAGNGPRWRGALLKRGRKGTVRLMIAGPKSNSVSHSASPMVYRCQDREDEIRWDSMFQNLNPT